MGYETIRHELSDGVAVLTLARPAVMNALNAQMRAELTDAFTRAADTARVVVLTGEGRAFCSGQDLADPAMGAGMDLGRLLREEYEPMLHAIRACPLPVIAAVNGIAAGAGASLALAADVVIATEGASFVQAFTKIGLMPDAGGTWWLSRTAGVARAMGMALFADRITARQAADWGMIWEAVPDESFEAHWRARAAHLAKGPTAAYHAVKQALREPAADFAGQLALEARLQGQLGQTSDFAEGVAAFLEKRAPRYEGH